MYIKRKLDYVFELILRIGLELIWRKMIEFEILIVIVFNLYGGMMVNILLMVILFLYRVGNFCKIQYVIDWGEDRFMKWYMKLMRKLYWFMIFFVFKNLRQLFFNYWDIELGINFYKIRSYVEGKCYGEKYFVGNFERLVEIKIRVDIGNFFRNENSIFVKLYFNS